MWYGTAYTDPPLAHYIYLIITMHPIRKYFPLWKTNRSVSYTLWKKRPTQVWLGEMNSFLNTCDTNAETPPEQKSISLLHISYPLIFPNTFYYYYIRKCTVYYYYYYSTKKTCLPHKKWVFTMYFLRKKGNNKHNEQWKKAPHFIEQYTKKTRILLIHLWKIALPLQYTKQTWKDN